jgi:hypothetical protein
MPLVFCILLALWLASVVANLIHWHGSGRLYFRPVSVGGRVIQLSIAVAGFLFLILIPFHIISASMIVIDFFFALSTIQHVSTILRRRRERGQRHEAASA